MYVFTKNVFIGWPKETPLSKPLDQLLAFSLIILSGFLLPIIISCIIYVKIIFYKKRRLKNKVKINVIQSTAT
jgi:hypothetical protein